MFLLRHCLTLVRECWLPAVLRASKRVWQILPKTLLPKESTTRTFKSESLPWVMQRWVPPWVPLHRVPLIWSPEAKGVSCMSKSRSKKSLQSRQRNKELQQNSKPFWMPKNVRSSSRPCKPSGLVHRLTRRLVDPSFCWVDLHLKSTYKTRLGSVSG